MPITIAEKFASRKGDAQSRDLLYVAVGSSDDVAVRAAVLDTAPGATDDGLPRRDTQTILEPVAPLIWDATVHYGLENRQPQAGDDPDFSFDTTGGTQHITHSNPDYGSIGRYGINGDSAPDNGGSIGATADGIEGCDIVVPVFHFAETHFFAPDYVTDDYLTILYTLTGTLNVAAWRIFEAGEVLFLGASGARHGTKPWAIGYRFAASPNKYKAATDADAMRRQIVIPAGVTTSGTAKNITITRKDGWDYFWVRSIPSVIQGTSIAACLTMTPRHAYVHPVYRRTDFTQLAIG